MPKKNKIPPEVMLPKRNKSVSVDIKKANNGYVVSNWDDDKQNIYIAKNKKLAMKFANKILKSKGI